MRTVSIIICTRNRAASLRQTLASVARVKPPVDVTVELIVVDNGSTDETPAVLRDVALPPSLRLLPQSEPTAGLSRARNRGLASASGEIILFTDDDVRVPENWVEGMAAPIWDARGDAVAGGILLPPAQAYALSRPPYRNRRSWFACSEFLNPDDPGCMIGANMAFHRRVLQAAPAFDPALGAGALGFFEESLFSWQIVDGGFRITGALEVAVEHHFDLARLTPQSLIQVAHKIGRSRAYVFHHWQRQQSRLRALRGAWARLQLAVRRSAPGAQQGGDVTLRRLRLEEAVAFCDELRTQRRQAPRYQRRRTEIASR